MIDRPCVDASLLEQAAEASRKRLQTTLDDVKSLGCDPYDQSYQFRDICHRSRLRWDFDAPEEHGTIMGCGYEIKLPGWD